MSAEIEVKDSTFDEEVLKSRTPVMVDFWAPWCGPCRMIAPVVEELAKEYAGKLKVAKVNTDEHPGSATRFKISAIPTILFFKDGKVVNQIVGVHSKADIKRLLDQIIA